MLKTLLPIVLSLSAETFSKKQRQGRGGIISAPVSFDPNSDEETRKRIFAGDDCTCQYCGFRSEKFQLVHDHSKLTSSSFGLTKGSDRSGDPLVKPKDDSNLVTSCIFCHQCFHLDKVSDMKSGIFIWMPELSQAQIHHLARSIYVARITQGPMAEIARNTLELVMKRREEAINRIKTDDPKIVSLVLKDYITSNHYDVRQQKLDGLRLFPLDRRTVKEGELEFNQFPQILAYWRSKDGPFSALNPNDWVAKYQELKAA